MCVMMINSCKLWFLCSVFVFYCQAQSLYEGDSCNTKSGVPGKCRNIRKCLPEGNDFKRDRPVICSFDGLDPIVCCANAGPTTTTRQANIATTQRNRKVTTTTEYEPPVYDYVNVDTGTAEQDCKPVSSSMTARKTGKKAFDKCIEYQEKLIYPCEAGVVLSGLKGRANKCKHNADGLIVGGTDAAHNEFPHMVSLGYGENPSRLEIACGGTLISEKFIVTAGHCTSSRDLGSVTYILVNRRKRSEQIDLNKTYKIKNIIKHPQYKPPIKYNDIALLETAKIIKLDEFTVPACLDIGSTSEFSKAIATGWGLTEHRGQVSDTLQKVTLEKFTSTECSTQYPPDRRMKQGLNEQTQICYGDHNASKDTCQGDSGGPLQVYSKDIHCMYTLIGITSFGSECGFKGLPAIYTRLSPFTDWIESIVWP